MGKITDALKKAADERMSHLDKMNKIKERDRLIIKMMGESQVDPSIVTYFDPKALISEQYKTLRTNILSMNNGKPPRTFVITSSIYGEGKTVTSLNLAISLAQSVNNPKVLLIDADMRKGKLARYLGVNQEHGLSDILQETKKPEDVLFHLDDIKNLAFLGAGQIPENPAELLAGDYMKAYLSQMRKDFDFVILDTPPIISVTDAGIIGPLTEGVLMVIQAGRTQRGIIRRAEELLYQCHTKVIGHVLTNIEYHLPEYIYRYL
jgi:capsular exopolysaccharide synthesis family protein